MIAYLRTKFVGQRIQSRRLNGKERRTKLRLQRTYGIWSRYALIFALISMLLSNGTLAKTSQGEDNIEYDWILNNAASVYQTPISHSNRQHISRVSAVANFELEKGGTPWASAKQEEFDERQDAEIFRAVLRSIEEWKERRRIRHAKEKKRQSNLQAQRKKRSQDDKERTKQLGDESEKEPLKVCYDELGCFQEAGYIDLLPNSPEEVNTRYLLYNSRRSRGDTPLLDVSAQNISSLWEWVGKAFNVTAPTKVIIHGFGSSCSNVWVYEMRSALMSVEECNIICVDWEAGATIPNYVRAAANTRLVGKQVAILLSGLETFANLSVRNVHVIGFSLGAHVAGFAGSELKNLSRITGLDPAGPLFESQDRRARLDSMDAQFVDVIHSNGENLILGGLGAWQPMGHVDFYPNGGRMQKGCTNLFVGAVSDMIWSANEVYGRSLCNHRRAYKFFTDSVSPKCQFPAVPCESYDHFIEGKCFPCQNIKDCNNMGYYADKFSGRGTLYLLTRDEEPFCANQYMVKLENSPDYEPSTSEKTTTFGKIQITLIGDLELNETFVITQKKDEKLVSGESVSRIIVPHPALQNFLEIQVLYIAYNGWLSSGTSKWRINKISLTNSYGFVLSACKEDLTLESGVAVVLQLVPKDCNVRDIANNQTVFHSETNSSVTTEYHHHYRNKSVENTNGRTQIVRMGNEILSNQEYSRGTNSSFKHIKHHPPQITAAGIVIKINGSSVISNQITATVATTAASVTPTTANATAIVTAITNITSSTSPIVFSTTSVVVGHLDKANDQLADYMNEPWKEKTELVEAVAANVYNHLDGGTSLDDGTGRHLIHAYVVAEATENNPEAAMANLTTKRKEGVGKNKNPYEFVTEQISSNVMVVYDSNKATEAEITEPVLKPKIGGGTNSVSLRTRKSQNTYRPHYGKSINIGNPKWRTYAARANASTLSPENSLSRSIKNSSEDKKNSSQLFVVQFLPQKLISFFEQAEKYARLAFLPFISPTEAVTKSTMDRARRVRHFGSSNHEAATDRHDSNKDDTRNGNFPYKLTDFPYNFHHSHNQLWQHVWHDNNERKYIPLSGGNTDTADSHI